MKRNTASTRSRTVAGRDPPRSERTRSVSFSTACATGLMSARHVSISHWKSGSSMPTCASFVGKRRSPWRASFSCSSRSSRLPSTSDRKEYWSASIGAPKCCSIASARATSMRTETWKRHGSMDGSRSRRPFSYTIAGVTSAQAMVCRTMRGATDGKSLGVLSQASNAALEGGDALADRSRSGALASRGTHSSTIAAARSGCAAEHLFQKWVGTIGTHIRGG